MRLTGGEGKGRRLSDPPPGVRPTSGRVKELLFQLIADRLDGAHVLDLFAGSGALGLEALARGAAHAVFVEQDRRALKAISENVRKCGFEQRGKVVPGDVFRRLNQPGRIPGPFELIFADPPYAHEVFGATLRSVAATGVLAEDGLVVFEAASRTELEIPEGWELADDRTVGDTRLLFLQPVA